LLPLVLGKSVFTTQGASGDIVLVLEDDDA
jgi:hypothetical protein